MKKLKWALLIILATSTCFGAGRDRYNPVTALEIAWALRDNADVDTAAHLYNLYTEYNAIAGFSPALDSPSFWQYTKAFGATDIPVGVVGRVVNSGSTQGAGGHLVGTLGWAEDTTNGKINLIGAEGKALMKGTAASGNGVLGQGLFQGSTFAGAVAGVNATVSVTTDGTVALNEGTAFSFYAPAIVGGANKFGLYISDPARINQNGSLTKYVELKHDGTNASVTSSSGDLNLVAPEGSEVVAERLAASSVSTAIAGKISDGYSFSPTVKVAAYNSPAWAKSNADYVCGQDASTVLQQVFDFIQTQSDASAGYYSGGTVELATGTYICNSTVYLPATIWIRGQGVYATQIFNNSNTNQPTMVFDSYYRAKDTGAFIVIEALSFHLTAGKTNSSYSLVLANAYDAHLYDIFFTGGGNSDRRMNTGLIIYGGWGVNIDRCLAEWHSGSGVTFASPGSYYTGSFGADAAAFDAAIRSGCVVTQASSGATGEFTYASESAGAINRVYVRTTSGTFDATGTLAFTGFTSVFTYTSKSVNSDINTTGPKVEQCKFIQNDGHGVVVENLLGTIIEGCELGNDAGTAAVYINGSYYSQIHNNRILSTDGSGSAAIYYGGSACESNSVRGNMYQVRANSTTPFIYYSAHSHVANVACDNIIFSPAAFNASWWSVTELNQNSLVGFNTYKNNIVTDGANDLDYTGYYNSVHLPDSTAQFYSKMASYDTVYDNSLYSTGREFNAPEAYRGQKFGLKVLSANKLEMHPRQQAPSTYAAAPSPRDATHTVVTTWSSHGFANGDSVTIIGTTGAEYDGTYTIANVAASSFEIEHAFGTNPAAKGNCSNNTIVFGEDTLTVADTLASSTVGSFATLECFVDNVWTVTSNFGTWAEETND